MPVVVVWAGFVFLRRMDVEKQEQGRPFSSHSFLSHPHIQIHIHTTTSTSASPPTHARTLARGVGAEDVQHLDREGEEQHLVPPAEGLEEGVQGPELPAGLVPDVAQLEEVAFGGGWAGWWV